MAQKKYLHLNIRHSSNEHNSSGRLFDVVGNLLGYTSDDMDYLFEHKELPEQEVQEEVQEEEEQELPEQEVQEEEGE